MRCASRRGDVTGMANLHDGFDDLITSLYAGVFTDPYWNEFLDTVRVSSCSDYVSLTFRRADAQYRDVRVIKSGSGNGYPEFKDDILEVIRKLDLPYGQLEPGRPFKLCEIVDFDDPKNREYLDYLDIQNITNTLVMRVLVPGGGTCWITLGRSQGDFPEATEATMRRIAPHLATAARTLAALEQERTRAAMANAAVERLNFGWLTFDAAGHVIELAPGLEAQTRRVSELALFRKGRMFPIRRTRNFDLTEILADFANMRSLNPRAVHLIDEPWLDMLIMPIRDRAVTGGATPVAIGYIHGVGEAGTNRCEHLSQLFGLTASEARLALAISQGLTIVEAAESLNLTAETARNYSKRIYAKTGTRGQSDLVRTILASVISLS